MIIIVSLIIGAIVMLFGIAVGWFLRGLTLNNYTNE